MPPLSKLERARINKYLQSHGLGGLDDPTLNVQLAFFVRDHEHFRSVLLRVDPAERVNCYNALAPKLRFQAKPLEDYIREGKEIAEKEQLPSYDEKTFEVKPFSPGPISETAKEALSGKTKEEREAAAKAKKEQAQLDRVNDRIAEQHGQEIARGRLEVCCNKCLFGVTVYAADRIDAYRTLASNGWHLDGDKAYCPDCRSPIVQ